MAKKKAAGKSLSQNIRDYLTENPTATPSEIVEGLGKQGVTVSTGLASNVKYTSGLGKKRRGRKKMVRRKRPGTQAADLSALQAAPKFVQQVGGDIDTAITAVQQVKQLQVG